MFKKIVEYSKGIQTILLVVVTILSIVLPSIEMSKSAQLNHEVKENTELTSQIKLLTKQLNQFWEAYFKANSKT